MALIYTKEIQVSSITHSKISGVDQTKLFRVLIKVNLKLERMTITKNPTSSSIDKEKELQNIRINTMNLSETMFTKKALM
jgi:hypothetical protein